MSRNRNDGDADAPGRTGAQANLIHDLGDCWWTLPTVASRIERGCSTPMAVTEKWWSLCSRSDSATAGVGAGVKGLQPLECWLALLE